MKKFSKLLAVVLAIAVVICPMMSAVAFADGENSVTLESVANNKLVLTINSANGFMVTKATVAFTGDVCNFNVEDYTLVQGTKDEYNLPEVSFNKGEGTATFIVSSTDAATLDLYSQVKIGITVAEGDTVTLNNLQAASDKDEDGEPSDGALISFEGISEDGTLEEPIEVEAEDPAPAGPVLDETLKTSLNKRQLLVGEKLGFYDTIVLTGRDYDDFKITITKKELNTTSYDYTGENIVEEISKSDSCVDKTYGAYNMFYVSYSGIALYEMSFDIQYRLTLYKGGVATVYCDYDVTSCAALANKYYTDNFSDATKRSFAVDLLNMANAAQVYFASQGTEDNALSKFDAPNASVDQQYATSYGTLTEIDGDRDAAVSTKLLLGSAPSLYYTINLASVQSAKTPSNLTFTCSYDSILNGKVTREVNGADLEDSEKVYGAYGLYYFAFDKVALFDANKVVTLTITDGTSSWVYEYSVLSQLSTVIDEVSAKGDLYRAVASFAATTRNMWPDL